MGSKGGSPKDKGIQRGFIAQRRMLTSCCSREPTAERSLLCSAGTWEEGRVPARREEELVGNSWQVREVMYRNDGGSAWMGDEGPPRAKGSWVEGMSHYICNCYLWV